ncbi:MAG TPA: nitroreductase family protein [Methanomicrobiales archaeon]|nr:nitroreductase family protein [Methanomicrobiales archaeon]
MNGILVDQDLCTRCGICSLVCPAGIIDTAEEGALPYVPSAKAQFCLQCGHCEATCPSGAVVPAYSSAGTPGSPAAADIPSETLGTYLKSRRSVRHYKGDPVDRPTLRAILDIARYAASAGNGQPVEWLVLYKAAEVRRMAELSMEWLRGLADTSHPLAGFAPTLVRGWESGQDPICRGAPHLLVPHVPDGNPVTRFDAIIALTHIDIAAPAFGVGTCWAGFVAMALEAYPPAREALALPEGRVPAYAMMLGYPRYRAHRIPERRPLRVTWR